MDKRGFLKRAESIICGERQDQYGRPEDSFQKIADYWGVYLRGKGVLKEDVITKEDVAIMMILLKIARQSANPMYEDNYVDICGYAALLGAMSTHNYAKTSAPKVDFSTNLSDEKTHEILLEFCEGDLT